MRGDACPLTPVTMRRPVGAEGSRFQVVLMAQDRDLPWRWGVVHRCGRVWSPDAVTMCGPVGV